jgi:hypothetical protein
LSPKNRVFAKDKHENTYYIKDSSLVFTILVNLKSDLTRGAVFGERGLVKGGLM